MSRRNTMVVGMLFGVFLLVVLQGCVENWFPQSSYPNGELLVSASDLLQLKDEKGVVIIDARLSGYETAHIPGAVPMSWSDYVDEGKNLRSAAAW